MSEITKLYENAGVEPEINYVCDKEPCEQHSVDCQKCSHLYDTREDYPDFTAEKQIELIKWLMNKSFSYSTVEDKDGIKYWFEIDYEISSHGFKNFEETIADTINEMWQTLTEEEKQQVKGILE